MLGKLRTRLRDTRRPQAAGPRELATLAPNALSIEEIEKLFAGELRPVGDYLAALRHPRNQEALALFTAAYATLLDRLLAFEFSKQDATALSQAAAAYAEAFDALELRIALLML